MNRNFFIYPGTTCAIMVILMLCLSYAKAVNNPDGIMPYLKNLHYWQYKGEPVLLLGATNHDNLFQAGDMIEQIDKLVGAVGNYIRCSMRSRDKDDFHFSYKIKGFKGLNKPII